MPKLASWLHIADFSGAQRVLAPHTVHAHPGRTRRRERVPGSAPFAARSYLRTPHPVWTLVGVGSLGKYVSVRLDRRARCSNIARTLPANARAGRSASRQLSLASVALPAVFSSGASARRAEVWSGGLAPPAVLWRVQRSGGDTDNYTAGRASEVSRRASTLSMRPYSFASAAVMK